MNQKEIFDEESEYLYKTDEEDEETLTHSSAPLSRNASNEVSLPWPRSYRRSVDLLTGVTPPTSTSFLSSFTTSSPTKQQQLLVGKDENQNSVVSSIQTFVSSHLQLSVPGDFSVPQENCNSTFSQSVLNGINVLCGVALLTMPYAVKEGGWLGLLVIISFGIITFYTGLLLKRCLENSPGVHSYPDIGQAAFGTTGRILVSILLYLELYAGCVEYIIMMSDNLSRIFPDTSLYINGLSLDSNQIFAITTTLIVLPTVWLKDLSLLSYLSAGGVFSSLLLALCLFWAGSVDGVGFHINGQALDITNIPVAIGIYGCGFAGHSVFPNIYSSMKEPSKFPMVLLLSFAFCTLFYTGIAVCGYTMFGDEIKSQFTLNMPRQFTSSKIAVWTAVVTPMTKYALTITPVMLSIEEFIPSSSRKMRTKGFSMFLRTIIVLSILVVALTVPFFATVAALIGSFIAMLIALIFPCLCYLRIMKGKLTNFQMEICILIVVIGVVSGCCGTYSAIARLVSELS